MIELIVLAVGLIIGSFLNALIWRLHSGESMLDRSRCPHCHKVISWYDNVPLLSYLVLLGRCRQCKAKISWQYPIVELLTGILFLLAWQHALSVYFTSATFYLLLLRDWFVISCMVIVFVYDLRWYLILDKVTLPASVVLLLCWLADKSVLASIWPANGLWFGLFLTVAIGYGFFAIQYYGSKGKWLGGGDVKLGLVMAIALARPSLMIGAIFIAYLLGAVAGLALIAAGKKEMGSKMPFGTFLALSTVVMLIWGEKIINWYLHLAGF